MLTGCTSIPDASERASLNDLSNNTISGWEATPALVTKSYRQATELVAPGRIPERYYQQKIQLALSQRVSADELAQIIQMAGIPTMLATEDLASVNAYIPRYEGPIGALLDSLSGATDLSFTWRSGVLVIDKDSPYLLKIPQNEDIADAISTALSAMGAEDVQSSKEAGIVSFRASSRNQSRIEAYLDRLSLNTSMINLQLAVINVTLDEERRRGLDWSSLSIQAGDVGLISNGGGSPSAPVGDTGGDAGSVIEGGAETQGLSSVLSSSAQIAGSLSGSSAGIIFDSNRLNIEAVLNMLSTYGESQTVQNLTLKTISGIPVELRSGESIPYIDEINLSIDEGTTAQGTTTSTVDTGFDVNVTPMFDAEDGLVTIELDLSMKSLVQMVELSTGGKDGSTLVQPRIQEQSMTNIARLEAGETALIGGLVYKSLNDNRSSLSGMEDLPIASQATRNRHNAMFVLMRPTVVVYGPRRTSSEVPE